MGGLIEKQPLLFSRDIDGGGANGGCNTGPKLGHEILFLYIIFFAWSKGFLIQLEGEKWISLCNN